MLSHSIKNGFPLGCETTEDEHDFRGNGIDDIADPFVVEDEVDELGDLEIIYRDLRLPGCGNNEVRLDSPREL